MWIHKGLRLLVIAVLLCGLSPISSALAQTAWLNSGWQYRRPVTVTNNTGNALTDYQVLVALGAGFDFTSAAANGADVRITAANGTTLLPFWIETWNTGGQTARIWVRVNSLPVGDSTLYLYYGNSGASSASDGASTFIFFDDFENFDNRMNANAPLTTPTYDTSGQVVHPDIVYVPGGWNGYAYWMAMTPYPGSADAYENPSILVSDDGLTWEVPDGLTNPLVLAPATGHNADPDILLVDNTLMVYYIEYTGYEDEDLTLFRVLTSSDGIAWSDPQTVFSFTLGDYGYGVSPAVLYEDGTFYMWYVRNAGCDADESSVYLRTSTDGLSWGAEQPVTLSLPGQVVWHPDVQWNGSSYVMLYAAYPDNLSCTATSLYYAESPNRVGWTATTTPVLTPNPRGGWDARSIYRSTFLVQDTSLRIWYSAQAISGDWHVGYTAGTLDAFLEAQTRFFWDTVANDVSATTAHARSGSYGLRQGGSGAYPRVTKDITGTISFNAWLYDDVPDGEVSDRRAFLRIRDIDDRAIGIGLHSGDWQTSYSNYVYHTAAYRYFDSGPARSRGWHRLTINVGENTSALLIDGVPVVSLADLDETNIAMISLEGYLGGEGYFDDAYVRQFADPAPLAIVGARENNPTAITLAAFTAQPGEGQIIISWETASELDNVGFNLYRSDTVGGPYILLNADLIPSQVPGTVEGAVYTWYDEDVYPSGIYYYKLEDIDVKGVRVLHGPVRAMLGASPNAVRLQALIGLGATSLSVLGLLAIIGAVLFDSHKRHNP